MESATVEDQDAQDGFAIVSAPKQLSTGQDFAWICSVLKPHSHNWKQIAAKLGFTAREISSIEYPVNADPYTYLRSVLFRWLQLAFGNAKDSRYYPTPDFLQKVLEISRPEIGERKMHAAKSLLKSADQYVREALPLLTDPDNGQGLCMYILCFTYPILLLQVLHYF